MIILSFISFSYADIIHVPADIDSIQGGIDLAQNGDTVLVEAGTYYENINFMGKKIVVGSLFLTTGDTSFISKSVIDGDSDGTVVTISDAEDSMAVLSGFTITNGTNTMYQDHSGVDWRGGGIIVQNSSLLLENLIVKKNGECGTWGGGIFLDNSNVYLNDAVIHENNEAGIVCVESDFELNNVKITNNLNNGIAIHLHSNVKIVNTLICGNEGTHGGGMEIGNSDLELSNVTIKYNTAYEGGGIFFTELDTNTIIFDSQNLCNIYSNTAPKGSDLYSVRCNVSIVVDTFTTLYPTNINASPIDSFSFDIKNDLITNINDDIHITPYYFSISQNYPNPFNPITTIEYSLPTPETVQINIYNTTGQLIKTLLNKPMPSGNYKVDFNADNLSSGVYFYRIEAGKYRDVKKMILLR